MKYYHYLLSDCSPNCGTVVAAGSPEEIFAAIDERQDDRDKVVRLSDTHAVGDRISVDWSESLVPDLTE